MDTISKSERAGADAYGIIFHEVIEAPVPNEGLVLPNDILRSHPYDDTEPRTQHERLVREFYALILDAFEAARGDIMTYGRTRSAKDSLR